MKKSVGFISIVFAMLIWGMTPVIVKSALDLVKPGMIMFIRALHAIVFLLLFCVKRFSKTSKKLVFTALFSGIFVSLGYLTQTAGTFYTTPARSAFLENVYCIVVPLLIWMLTKKRPAIYEFLCMALCIFGVVLLSITSIGKGAGIGDILCALAGVFFGVNIVLTGLYIGEDDIIVYTFIQMCVVCVMSLAYTLVFEKKLPTFEAGSVLSFLFLGIFATAIAWLLRNKAQSILSPLTIGIVLPFSSVFGTVISIIAGMDKIDLSFVFGALLILSAIFTDTIIKSVKEKKERDLQKEMPDG